MRRTSLHLVFALAFFSLASVAHAQVVQPNGLVTPLDSMNGDDELKFVIGSREDYDWVREQIRERKLGARPYGILYSTVHGAGRAMSRTKAAGKWRKRDGVRVREGGAVDFAAVTRELAAAGIELRGGAADEAPAAYKRLAEVLAEQGEQTIRVTHELRPLGVAMAGADTFDPFKD